MRLKFYMILAVAFLLWGSKSTWAQQPPAEAQQPEVHQPPGDPIGENFIPPDMLIHNREALGLNDEQMEFLQGQFEKTRAHFTELQQKLGKEMDALTALLKSDRPDESKVLAQLDKVLDVEREMKRTHLSLMVGIKNKLTPEQFSKSIAIKGQWARFQSKMQQVQAGVQRSAGGRPRSNACGRDHARN